MRSRGRFGDIVVRALTCGAMAALLFVGLFSLGFPGWQCVLGVLCTSVVAFVVLWPFPRLANIDRGVPFTVVYIGAYVMARELGSGWNSLLAAVAVLLGGAACVAIVRTSVEGSAGGRFPWPLVMVALGLATAFFSGPQGGAGRLMTFLTSVLHLSTDAASAVNFLVRKAVHLTVYGSLAVSAAAVARRQTATAKMVWLAGYAWAVPHAVADEATQSRTSVRTGSPWDVALDIVGMSIALWAAHRHWKAATARE